MSFDIRQDASGSQNVTMIGVQNLNLVSIPRAWKRPNEADPVRRWERAVGRRAELDALKDQLAGEGRAAITAAVAGMAGVGKSTLVSIFVREHAAAYPGGVLWAELGVTFDDARRGEVLEHWACYAYGGDVQFVTQVLLQQNFQLMPEAVRALLSGQGPLLVVLDDVWDYAAAEPLVRALPPDTHLIATTRDVRIAEAFGRQNLEVLVLEDALALLGQDLADLPESLLTQLAERLGRHAQALRIAAGDVKRRGDRARREKAIADLLDRVREGKGFGSLPPLDQVSRQDKVESALKFSYDDVGVRMGADYQRRFRQLGVFAPPEADFGTIAAAGLWNDDPDAAAEFLDVLHDRNMLTQTAEGRWRQHALLRAYALALLKDAGEEADARLRHLEFYQGWARYWSGKKFEHIKLEPNLDQYRQAFVWAKEHATEWLVGFVDSGWQFLYLLNHYADLRLWLDTALRMAEERKDVLGQARTLVALGELSRVTGDPAARTCYDHALSLYEQVGNVLGQANTLMSLGELSRVTGASAAARTSLDRALPLYEQVGNVLGQANTLMECPPKSRVGKKAILKWEDQRWARQNGHTRRNSSWK